jgi:hypothetical protein
VILRVDQRLRLNVSLELGALEETVEVSGAPTLIETDSASQGTVVENRRIIELPLNGRSFQQLAYLGPGVIAPPAGAVGRFSVSGVRGTSNSFMLDGASDSQPGNDTYVDPSIELIEEFKIQRNTFNAEYGRGAAQVNVVTRSGTNQFHLTLFEFIRNDKLQARDFFDSAKPALRRNQFGGTAAGPLIRNRAFWLGISHCRTRFGERCGIFPWKGYVCSSWRRGGVLPHWGCPITRNTIADSCPAVHPGAEYFVNAGQGRTSTLDFSSRIRASVSAWARTRHARERAPRRASDGLSEDDVA